MDDLSWMALNFVRPILVVVDLVGIKCQSREAKEPNRRPSHSSRRIFSYLEFTVRLVSRQKAIGCNVEGKLTTGAFDVLYN